MNSASLEVQKEVLFPDFAAFAVLFRLEYFISCMSSFLRMG